jgi:type III secretory pathway component EscU
MIYADVPAFVFICMYALSASLYMLVIRVFHAMFTIPNVALENAMACRVFRIVKFDTTRSYIDAFGAPDASSHRSMSHRGNHASGDPEAGGHALVNLRPTQIAITKEVVHEGFDFPYKHDSP